MRFGWFPKCLMVLAFAACFALGWGNTPVASAEVDMSKVDTSIQAIIGTWREGDALDARILRVNPDYTYELDYRGGGASYGSVRVIAEEHPDGTYTPWYAFDEPDGKNWAMFPKNDEDGTLQKNLWSGQDGALHFIRFDNYEYAGKTEGITPESYLGVWACGRCTIVIEKVNNAYVANVKWANSAAEHREWIYSCRYDKDSAIIVCPGNGICTDSIVYDNGKENDVNVYADGSCEFVLREGVLKWYDNKDKAGQDMDFLR